MKLAQFNACLSDQSMSYQEKNVPDTGDPLWRVYAITGDIIAGCTSFRMATMLRRASSHELVLKIMVYKSAVIYDMQAPCMPVYNGESSDITFTFTCDARSIGRLWRTLPLWRWAVPYSMLLSLVGELPARPEGNMVAVRQAWSDYFSGFGQPFKGLELTGIYVEAL